MFKKSIQLILLLTLMACSSTQSRIQTTLDHKLLKGAVGKSYTEISSKKKYTVQALLGSDPEYGEFISSYTLPDGSRVMRHMDRYIGGGMQFGGALNMAEQKIAYRLFYFKVDKAGIIRDWASGFYNGESQKSVGVSGFQIPVGETQNALPIQSFDGLVLTSAGQQLGSWGPVGR